MDDAQGGGLFPLDWGIFDPASFELLGEVLVQADVSLGVGGGFWGRLNHPGGGSLQSLPIPEKPNISKVSPIGALGSGCDITGARRLGGVRCMVMEGS